MSEKVRLFPVQASTLAERVDPIFFFELAVAAGFTTLIAGLIVYFVVRYRHRDEPRRSVPQLAGIRLKLLEATWTLIPFGLCLVMFIWSARVYVWGATPPADAEEVLVVAKQWMWKFQHVSGAREINELHVPVDRAIKLLMTSEDVIHSFYVPEFRVKMDVLPNRYTVVWTKPTKVGSYYLLCAQYCGTQHARMGGKVIVMSQADYGRWLAARNREASPVQIGAALFVKAGCVACHKSEDANRAPPLDQVFGSTVLLADGRQVLADEEYLRESIVEPGRKVVAGYTPIMPTYRATFTDEELIDLVAYIKSLGALASVPGGNGLLDDQQQ